MPDSDIVTYLKETPMFHRLSKEYLRFLEEHMETITLGSDETLFKKNEDANHFYFVMQGVIGLYTQTSTGGEALVQTIGAGWPVGWSWVVPPYQWNFTAKAREACILMKFQANPVRAKCGQDHSFGYAVMQSACAMMLDRMHNVRANLTNQIVDLEKQLAAFEQGERS